MNRARWRVLAMGVALALCRCVSAPYHSCPDPCGSGRACDTAVGQCHDDPCEGRCVRGERCEAGPPAVCELVPISDLEVVDHPDMTSPAGGLH